MSSSGRSWTVDGISHALPHSELRATFMREIGFTDVRELPAVLNRWVKFIETFEADRERVEHLRTSFCGAGNLPSTYRAGLIDVSAEELRSAAGQSGAHGWGAA
ncbi:hypothetical protein ACFU90_23275 [Streptomyces noursei]|uniref:Uncharacterized protein n=1 Tax=Streptomyces noursei TaxID=1971 RepID=A0A401QUI4_STRNR|nr:hypothetical protein [Streptomyces noursei]AKA08468.1 hypothetical protein SAZ_04750 [Streptomyces noursei ZPM]EOT00145.1 hypothetical protein K530_30321 [Streptomyces noursei CCRC 11814]EXU90032.1 hypothetical protein P354_18530 [Streptomyces noursei PD-1]MCZ0971704.1 hypothetical protein [Streptomyces noursei]UWS70285.1 hypothetical protein N1H47_03005 [Streptomyces noursei]